MSKSVPGRSCGKCHLCCKLFKIDALGKPDNVWCAQLEIGSGCKDYDGRPQQCRDFLCRYMTDAKLGDEWHPSKAHFVLRGDGMQMVVHVVPERPDAWKREPYHSALRNFARNVYPRGGLLFARIGERSVAILPDRDVDLGICPEHERVNISTEMTSSGPRWKVEKQRK